MERDAIVGHGVMDFVRESYTKRADGYSTYVCNSCGTIPIYNESKNLFICSLCDGPVEFIGNSVNNLDILPPNKRSLVSFSKIEIPYSMKLLDQELAFFMNIGMRVLSGKDVTHLRGAPLVDLTGEQMALALKSVLPERVYPETLLPEKIEVKEEPVVSTEDLSALGAITGDTEKPVNAVVLNAAMNAAVNAALNSSSKSPSKVQSEAVNAAVNAAVSAANSVNAGLTGPAPVPVTNSTNSVNGIQLNVATPSGVTFSGEEPIGEDEYETLPESNSGVPTNSVPTNSGPRMMNSGATNNSINVQTNSQPVLVVPMNVSQPAASQYIPPPAPGAPPTLAFDTSEPVLRNLGLPPTNTNSNSRRPRTNSNSSAGSANSGNGSNSANASAANVKVNVVKEDS
jgi:hypothetical protein